MIQKNIFGRIVLVATAMLMSVSAFAQTVIPERDWEYIRVDDEHVSIGNADKSRRVSAIDQGTAGDIEIPLYLQSSMVVNIAEQAFEGCTNLTSVVIPDGVTNIAKRAFYGCTSLTNVVIPASVKAIGELAFYSCKKLQQIKYVNGSEVLICKSAFRNCTSAMSIEISTADIIEVKEGAFTGCIGAKSCELRSKMVSIAEMAFSSYNNGNVCRSITNAVINASSTASIGKKVFFDCDMMATAVIMADSVASVGNLAFSDCGRLEAVSIFAGSTASIDDSAFFSCGSLGVVTINAGTTASVGDSAFSNCAKLDSVSITAGATASVGNSAFSGCAKLVTADFPDVLMTLSSNVFYHCSSLKSFTCPINLTRIAYRAFDTCTTLEHVKFNDSLETIEVQAFYGCSSLQELEFPQSIEKVGSRAFEECRSIASIEFKEGDTNLPSAVSVEIGDRAFYRCSATTNIILSQNVKSFGSKAFSQCDVLKSVVLPKNLTAISESAFEDCVLLSTLDLPPSLKSIGLAAFRGCSNYCEFLIPTNSVVDIGAKAFYNTKYWNDWPDDSIVINNGYIFGFKGNPTSVVLPEGCKIIPAGMFENMSNLTNVIIPAGVVSVGSRAFANSGIVAIMLNDAETIEVSAFEGCSGLASVSLSANLTVIPDNAFKDCTSLTRFNIPDRVNSVGAYAFFGCSSLQTVTGGEHVGSIGDYAFANCTAFEPRLFPSDVIYGVHVFQGCVWDEYVLFPAVGTMREEYPQSYSNIRSVVFPYGHTNIVDDACRGCAALEYIDIPDSVVSVGSNAFYGCSSVTSVVMTSALADVAPNAFVGCSNIVSATVSGAIPVMTLFPDVYATIKYFSIAKGCDVLCDDLFHGCAAIEQIEISEAVTSIGARAFYGCTSLGAGGVLISDKVTSIGEEAFAFCALEYVDIPDSVASVGSSAFYGCSSVTSVVMAAGLTDIASNVFVGCSNIVSATVSGAIPVMTLFPDAYPTIKDFSIAQGCDALCGDLFHGCAAIEQIEIPWTVTSIGDRAFYGCTSLGASGVLIPEKVTAIGENAFAFCSSLESVRFLCPKPDEVAENIYYKANPELVTAVLQPYKDSWQSVMTNSWPVANSTVMGRRIVWWNTDCLAKITFAYYNGTGKSECQYYLKNAGRTIEELPEPPADLEYDEKKYGDFLGWFTDPYGGEEVEEGCDVTTSTVLYAHWSGNEIDDSEEGDYDFSAAHTYNGYVLDNGALVGSVQIKIGKGRYSKADEETNAVANATFQLLGEGKVAAKGILHEDASGELVHRKSARELTISIDGSTVSGSFDGLDVVAGRDFFSSSVRPDTIRAKTVLDELGGLYNVVLSATPDGDYAFCGYVGISLQIGQRGSVKISGALPDGTKLTASCPLVCLDDQIYVPAVIPAYSGKKGGIAFMLNFSEGDMILDNVSDWIGAKGEAIGSLEAEDVSDVVGLQNGEYQFVADISDFEIEGETIDDSFSPDGTVISVLSGRWRVPRADAVKFVGDEGYATAKDNGNPSGLKLSYTAKTGLFKGSFKLYGVTDGGKSKKHTVMVSGAVVNGVGYGCAYIKKVGGVPVAVDGGIE